MASRFRTRRPAWPVACAWPAMAAARRGAGQVTARRILGAGQRQLDLDDAAGGDGEAALGGLQAVGLDAEHVLAIRRHVREVGFARAEVRHQTVVDKEARAAGVCASTRTGRAVPPARAAASPLGQRGLGRRPRRWFRLAGVLARIGRDKRSSARERGRAAADPGPGQTSARRHERRAREGLARRWRQGIRRSPGEWRRDPGAGHRERRPANAWQRPAPVAGASASAASSCSRKRRRRRRPLLGILLHAREDQPLSAPARSARGSTAAPACRQMLLGEDLGERLALERQPPR